MLKPILLLLIAVSILTACSSGPPPMPAVLPSLPAADMQPAPELPPPASGSLPDLLTNHVDAMLAYHQLAQHQANLVRWLRQVWPTLEGRSGDAPRN